MPAPSHAQQEQPANMPGENAAERALWALFIASDAGDLKLNPISALFRGDQRYADQFGDYLSDDYLAATQAKARDELAQLNAIDRSALGPKLQIAYDVFAYQLGTTLRMFDSGVMDTVKLAPINHMDGFQAFYPDFSSGQSAAPFKTEADYRNNLARLDGYLTYLERAQARMAAGLDAGVVLPRVVTQAMINQIDAIIDAGVEGSPFWMPIAAMPEAIPAATASDLAMAYRSFIQNRLLPRHKTFSYFLKSRYLPAGRVDAPGLVGQPGGPALYAHLVESQTTTDLTPEAIHAIGLSEVTRIKAEMEAVRRQVSFAGDLTAFFEHIRTDPQFKPESEAALIQMYYDVNEALKPVIPQFFSRVPKTGFEVRPVPAFSAENAPGAYYQAGTPDGSRPGVFYANTYDLPSRTTPTVETLFLHEAIPGHHFQVSLAQEDEELPPFMRFGGNVAYVEGWALYAESLGKSLGLFTDPYQYFGRLQDEMLRAMRLVVDTGLHAKGWSREQAIDYMLANSSMSRTEVVAEVERYIAIPGQALGYKIGQLEISRLRAQAEAALGDGFDIRAFHDQVLNTGALPLAVLTAKIEAWIAGQQGQSS